MRVWGAAASGVGRFMVVVGGFGPLAVAAGWSILGVAGVLGPPLVFIIYIFHRHD